MNRIHRYTLGVFFGIGLCASASAQTLSDFTNFNVPDYTFFAGDWVSGGEPLSTFIQGPGYYEIKGGTDNGNSEAVKYFGSDGDYVSINAAGGLYVSVSAKILAGNQASSFRVTLYDSADRQASSVFNTADFSSSDFTTVLQTVTATSGSFDYSTISSFRLSGDIIGGAAAFNIAFNEVGISSAIPEPASFAVCTGAFLCVICLVGQWRRSSAAQV